MYIEALLFVLGLVFLVKGSDVFVHYAGELAKKFGVSEFIIGLTVVALGTSIPELASSIVASLRGNPGLIIGNVIGSNIANIGLVIGVSAILAVIITKEDMLKRDGYIMLFSFVVLALLMIDGSIGFVDAIILLVLYFAYTMFLFENTDDPEVKRHFGEFFTYFLRLEYVTAINRQLKKSKNEERKKAIQGIYKDIALLVVGGICIVIGAKFLVQESIFFATLLGVSDTVIGLSIVAIGTSLPELSVTIAAVRKKLGDMAIGNILGSNVANALLVTGAAGIVSPIAIDKTSLMMSLPAMFLFTILLLIFIRTDWKVNKREGLLFLVLYVMFIAMLFLR